MVIEMNVITKEEFIHNSIWKLLEQFGAQGVTFILSIILARILTPNDYGIIALIMIFISFSDILVQGWVSVVIVQKTNVDNLDLSMAFFISFILSILMYIILYISAPFIALYYNLLIFKDLLRCMSIILFIDVISALLTAKSLREMKFKMLFEGRLISSVLSGALGIYVAMHGLGVWSLVVQKITQQIIYSIVLHVKLKWIPYLFFSYQRAKILAIMGEKVLLATIIAFISDNLYSMFVSKMYSPQELGYLNKGDQFPNIILLNAATAITSVALPTLSSYQNDLYALKNALRKIIRVYCYFTFPIAVGLIVIARNMVLVLLTDKWLPCAPILQILTLFYLTAPIILIITQAFYAIGKNEIRIKLETFKFFISLGVILCMYYFYDINVYWFIGAKPIISLLMLIVTYHYAKIYLCYTLLEQLKDIIKIIIITMIMAVVIFFINLFNLPIILIIIIQIIIGAIIYICLSVVFRELAFFILFGFLIDKFKSYFAYRR